MKVSYTIVLVFSLIVLSFLSYKMSTEKVNSDIKLPQLTPSYNLQKDIIYKLTPENEPLKLDIYQPKNLRKKTPVLIYFHGGAWSVGDKSSVSQNFRQYILDEVVQNNYIVISIDFTPINLETHLDKTLQDCQDVLQWIKDNSEQYQLDLNNVGVWGGSSGAHIAMLTAYNQKKEASSNIPELKYVVNFFGPSDLNELFKTDANTLLLKAYKLYSLKIYNTRKLKIKQLTGFDINTQKEQVIKRSKELSPVTYVNKHTVPTLIFHGTGDSTVDISQSQLLSDVLEENNIYHQYYILDNAKHSFSNINLNEAKDVAKKTVDFIKSQTKNGQ